MWEQIGVIAAVISALVAVLTLIRSSSYPAVDKKEKEALPADLQKPPSEDETVKLAPQSKSGNNYSGIIFGLLIIAFCISSAIGLWFIVLTIIGFFS